ncbi:MAG: Gfo/Idh/MocA family oxidoreductase [Planctomycetes bacterium]|nr:Gfo/Idh/MocA family oxidoreductase [Planctomycetota bacterium]
MSGLRAAVVGARRTRQGTGEWVARDLAGSGVEVCAIVGTTPEGRTQAQTTLRERYGIEAQTYGSLPELLSSERIDLVAICSPREAHLDQVRAALAAGCHVFCEKPFVWWEGLESDRGGEDRLREVLVPLLAGFQAKGLQLSLNCQWPFTLPGFEQLYPDARAKPLQRFEMHLGPTRAGYEALLDSGSHPLSMLYALAGASCEGLGKIRVRFSNAERVTMTCEFDYRGPETPSGEPVQVELRLVQHPDPPRPAGYAINGQAVIRQIQLPDYSLSFEGQSFGALGRSQSLPDPLTAAVHDVLARIRTTAPLNSEPVLAGTLHLHRLVQAARHAEETV